MSKVTASGGFAAPVPFHVVATRVTELVRAMPSFRAVRGGIDFRPAHVRWAETRERELRAEARMWNWPRPPA